MKQAVVMATAAVRYKRVTTGIEKYQAIGSCSASIALRCVGLVRVITVYTYLYIFDMKGYPLQLCKERIVKLRLASPIYYNL